MTQLEGHLWVRAGVDRTNHYYYRVLAPFFDNGQKKYRDVRRALGTNLEQAQREVRRLDTQRTAQAQGEVVHRDATIGAFLEWYVGHMRDERKLLGWKTPQHNLRAFLKGLGDRPLRAITRFDVETFLIQRKQQVRPTTVNSTLRDVKRMLTVAVERGYLDVNPAATVRPVAAKALPVKLPTAEEVSRLLGHLKLRKPYLYSLGLMLIGTGCRLGEAVALRWSDVDLARGTLVLRRRKVQDALAMVLVGPLKDVLWEAWTAQGMPKEGLVFLDPQGGPLNRFAVYNVFKRVTRKLGMPWLALKTFRKLAATQVAESTGDVRMAQMLLGHETVTTTERYLGRGEQARTKALHTMAGWLTDILGTAVGTKVGTGAVDAVTDGTTNGKKS